MQPKKGLANVGNRRRLSEAPRRCEQRPSKLQTPNAERRTPNAKRQTLTTDDLFYPHKCSDGADFEDLLGFFF